MTKLTRVERREMEELGIDEKEYIDLRNRVETLKKGEEGLRQTIKECEHVMYAVIPKQLGEIIETIDDFLRRTKPKVNHNYV